MNGWLVQIVKEGLSNAECRHCGLSIFVIARSVATWQSSVATRAIFWIKVLLVTLSKG